MGMSASQARLLSITARLNDVEYKSQNIANIKIRLADESERLALNYSKALGQQKYTYTTYATGFAQKIDLTVTSLLQPTSRYVLKNSNGKIVVNTAQKSAYENLIRRYNDPTADGLSGVPTNNLEGRLNYISGYYALEMIYGKEKNYFNAHNKADGTKCQNIEDCLEAGVLTQAQLDFYANQFKMMFENSSGSADFNTTTGANKQTDGVMVVDNSDPAWLYNAIESGEYILLDLQTGEYATASNTVALSIETDTSKYAIAEAEYNAANMKINNKEKLLDNELKKLDTEHNALQTEMDSIKNLIGKNIEKSFNLFS